MRWTGIRVQYAGAAVGIFSIGFMIAALISGSVVRDANNRSQATEVHAASAQAQHELTSLGQRMAAYANALGRNEGLARKVKAGDAAVLEQALVAELSALRTADPVVSTLEVTAASGIVLMRGHNPKQNGDDKSRLREFWDAMSGRLVKGLSVSPTSRQAAIDALMPLQVDGTIIGTLKVGARVSGEIAAAIKTSTQNEVALFYKGKPMASTFGKDVTVDMAEDLLQEAKINSIDTHITVNGEPYLARLHYVPAVNAEGIIVANFLASAPFIAQTDAFNRKMLVFGSIAVPFLVAFGFLAGAFFGRPLVDTAKALADLSKGEQADIARYSKRSDEIGDMARAFGLLKEEVENSFRLRQTVAGMPTGVMTLDRARGWAIDYLNPALVSALGTEARNLPAPPEHLAGRKAIELLGRAHLGEADLDTIPAGGLRRDIEIGETAFALTLANIHAPNGDKIGAMVAWLDVSERRALAKRFEAAVGQVAQSVETAAGTLSERASEVRMAAAATQAQAEAVARSSEESSVSVTTVASAAEELSASVLEISRQVGASTQIAHEAARDSERVVAVVQELQEVAGRIGSVVQLISNIAAQTNLLALNATIEAARAGEAGRGFAVVASEVKALASQTARAADEVVQQVNGIQMKTGEAVEAIDSISGVIGRITGLSSSIAAAVEQQRNATDEIARNTQQTASGTHEVAQSITEVSTATRQTEAAADEMLGSTQTLQASVTTLKQEVDDFLHALAA